MWIRVRDRLNSKKERLDLEDPAGQHLEHCHGHDDDEQTDDDDDDDYT